MTPQIDPLSSTRPAPQSSDNHLIGYATYAVLGILTGCAITITVAVSRAIAREART